MSKVMQLPAMRSIQLRTEANKFYRVYEDGRMRDMNTLARPILKGKKLIGIGLTQAHIVYRLSELFDQAFGAGFTEFNAHARSSKQAVLKNEDGSAKLSLIEKTEEQPPTLGDKVVAIASVNLKNPFK